MIGRLAAGGASAPFAARRLAELLGVGLGLRLQRRFGRGRFCAGVDPDVAEQRIEAERVEACREMLGNRRRDIERAAIGMVDTQPAAVQVQLAADRAGQKGGLAAIFAVADDRVADRRHMDAKLMRAAGERLKLDPRRAVAGAFDNPIARFRDQRSEEHTSELQSLMRISYAVFCLKKNKKNITTTYTL